jgi:predicted Zn-dependent peptidase
VLNLSSSEGLFPNGLRVIVETVPESELAGMALAVDAGSAKDPENQLGLAHLVEHSVFEARHGDTPNVERRLNQLAASWNAQTTHDVVVYHAFAPARAFDGLLGVFADIAAEPLAGVDEAAFSHEQQVVEAERGMRDEHVQGQVASYLYQAIFSSSHPYARPVGGTRESIAGLSLAQAQAFASGNYKPELMTLYVFAPSSLEPFRHVSAAFKARFGGPLAHTEAEKTNTFRSPLTLNDAGALVRHEATVPTPELWLAWPLPAGTVEQRSRAKSLAELVSALIRPSFTSHRAVAGAGCGLIEEVLADVLACQITLNDTHDPEEVIARTLSELRQGFGEAKSNHGWSWSVQRDAAVSASLALESPETRTAIGAEQAREFQNPFLDFEVVGGLANLDLNQVTSMGFELADRKNTYAMLVEPTSSSAATARAQGMQAQREQTPPGEPPDAQQTLALVKRAAPREIKEFQLQNGLTVIAERHRGTPFVSAILGFHGSSSWATDPALGEAAALAESWHVQTPPADAGLSLHGQEYDDDRRFVARSVSPDLDAVLKALVGVRFPHFEWPNLRFRRMLPALTRAENGFAELAARQERSTLFGEHPYSAFAPAARADHVTTQAVDRFLLSTRRPDNAVVVVVADVDPDEIGKRVGSYFGSWSNPHGRKLELPPPIPLNVAHPARFVVVDEPSPQVDLRFSCLIERGRGKSHIAGKILADTFATFAHDSLRDRTGIAYYASGSFRELAAGAGEISISTSVDRSYVGQALALFERFAQLGADDIPANTLAWRRFESLEAAAFRDSTTIASADSLYDTWLGGRQLSDLEHEPEFIASITKDDLALPLATCSSNSVIVAIGDRSAIMAARQR